MESYWPRNLAVSAVKITSASQRLDTEAQGCVTAVGQMEEQLEQNVYILGSEEGQREGAPRIHEWAKFNLLTDAKFTEMCTSPETLKTEVQWDQAWTISPMSR